MRVHYTFVDTNLGWLGIVGSDAGLRYITLPQPSSEVAHSILCPWQVKATLDASAFGDLPDRLRRYFRGEPVPFPDALDLRDATPFQCAVWQIARSIPYGETRSYGWVARQIGKPQAWRAVGQALARNPFPVVVPCHRVIASDGGLGGFSGGLEMKQRLLAMEVQGMPASLQHLFKQKGSPLGLPHD